MHRYFFPIELNGKSKRDADGVDLMDDAAAKREAIVTIAQLAAEDGSSFYNPREVVEEEVLKLVEKAF